MTSALALDAVLSSNTGHAVVGFTARLAAVSFHHNGNKKIKLAVSNQSMSHQLDTFLLPPFKNATTQTSLAFLYSFMWRLLHSGFAWISRHSRFCTLSHSVFHFMLWSKFFIAGFKKSCSKCNQHFIELPTFGTKTSVLNKTKQQASFLFR